MSFHQEDFHVSKDIYPENKGMDKNEQKTKRHTPESPSMGN